jgi:hypothetical protein
MAGILIQVTGPHRGNAPRQWLLYIVNTIFASFFDWSNRQKCIFLNKNNFVVFVIPAQAGIGSINRERSEPKTMAMLRIAVDGPYSCLRRNDKPLSEVCLKRYIRCQLGKKLFCKLLF